MKKFPRYIFILIPAVFCFIQDTSAVQNENENDTLLIDKLEKFQDAMQRRSPKATEYYNWIIEYIGSHDMEDSVLLSDCYYLTGTYNYLSGKYDEAIALLNDAISYRAALDSLDDLYARASTNLGLSYLYTGEMEKSRVNLEKALETREILFGPDSPLLLRTLLNLTAIYTSMNMHESALSTSQRGISMAEGEGSAIDSNSLFNLYFNFGVSCLNIQDFNRAERNFNLAYKLARVNRSIDNEKLLQLYNSMGACNYELGKYEISEQYFSKALQLADSLDLSGSNVNLLYVNYALFLASKKDYSGAERYYLISIDNADRVFGNGSRDYALQLLNYSYFLVYYLQDYKRAEKVLSNLLFYVEENQKDIRIAGETYLYLSRLLYSTGRYDTALEYINRNLDDSLLLSLNIQVASYTHRGKILFSLYKSNNDADTLKRALSSVEDAIKIVETSRLRIKEDESRSRISGRYIDLYDLAMEIVTELRRLTQDSEYEKVAFSISERSRAASLLLATRNNRTLNFHLPPELSNLESKLLSEIRDYNEVVYNETARAKPDREIIEYYQLKSVSAGARYDSLLRVFEKQYPRYYGLKHSTRIIKPEEISKIIGKDGNFIEYHLSDSLLSIFLVNKDEFVFRSFRTDPGFKDKIHRFRRILTDPSIVSGSRSQYIEFTNIALELYKTLILPVQDYLCSDRLLISTDDILSYIPFEALINEPPDYGELNYRELSYLLREYDITYEYSATILSETSESRKSLSNKVLSFAPDYNGDIGIEDLMQTRQLYRDSLTNIQGAREEAIYINSLLGGELFLDSEATESAFKRNILEGDIVHLAMHTLLNDSDPMYSKMVFSMEPDSIEDGLLNTYEVYNIPLKAKMLFLSSCNTGSGYLRSGEGVLSLARGFFYSGSPSVIMSLWEVDDDSGSDIVKDFYYNLKKGHSKSEALNKARIDYLAESDQMRSHPYFWSTLVIMGNDDSLYIPLRRYLLLVLCFVIAYRVFRYIYVSRSE